ncbi:hydroxymethylbilane synthase [Kitasatospora griseola]|uniref:hydroxymethylbilane synthase n=1 Tax=Kitasatospora griseola TaxID=2064 RepID=UPI003435F480
MVELVVGSRASQLARAQVREFLAPVRERYPDLVIRHRVILEDGDLDRKAALREVSERGGGSAFSTHQVAALLNREVDVVVHSLKDLPTENPDGLTLLPPPPRADVRDALCGGTLNALPAGARVGTSAARRIAQLLHVRPDLRPERIRGNVPTRLARLRTLDAVVVAAAGLHRIDRAEEIGELLPVGLFPPSPGQGALGIQVREDHALARELLDHTGDLNTDAEVRAERAMLAELHGGCSVPVGAFATTAAGGVLTLHGQVTSVDGARQVEARMSGSAAAPEKLGLAVAGLLLDQDADRILAEARALARPR